MNTGGPAFPSARFNEDDAWISGMTLRDYFAAGAMQGLLAAGRDAQWGDSMDSYATESYRLADAMLDARLA